MSQMILVASLGHVFFAIVLSITAVLLMLLVLVQRGRGGGLAGAFGGMGGQSAFGTKAGDTFTRITIGVSLFWILMCVAAVRLLSDTTGAFGRAVAPGTTQVQSTEPESPAGGSPSGTTTEPGSTSTTPPAPEGPAAPSGPPTQPTEPTSPPAGAN